MLGRALPCLSCPWLVVGASVFAGFFCPENGVVLFAGTLLSSCRKRVGRCRNVACLQPKLQALAGPSEDEDVAS